MLSTAFDALATVAVVALTAAVLWGYLREARKADWHPAITLGVSGLMLMAGAGMLFAVWG